MGVMRIGTLGQARDGAGAVDRLREEIPSAGPLGGEEELTAIRRPDREVVDSRVEGDAREREEGKIPQPDIALLIGD